MAAASAVPSASHTLEPEAFRNLYPDLYFDRFLENGIRPDGRAFGGARPVTIGPDAVGTADASALVKLGNTTVLSGLKFEASAALPLLRRLSHPKCFPLVGCSAAR